MNPYALARVIAVSSVLPTRPLADWKVVSMNRINSIDPTKAAYERIVISLPIADRLRSYNFYRCALGLQAIGAPADDGVPEPLQFVVNAGVRVMLVPRGGFGWTIGDGQVASPGNHECLLAIGAATEADTDALIERAVAEGADLVTLPGQQPWGYAGAFADPDGHIWMVRAEQVGSTTRNQRRRTGQLS
jgi:predicted lactoylglutathione lyase